MEISSIKVNDKSGNGAQKRRYSVAYENCDIYK